MYKIHSVCEASVCDLTTDSFWFCCFWCDSALSKLAPWPHHWCLYSHKFTKDRCVWDFSDEMFFLVLCVLIHTWRAQILRSLHICKKGEFTEWEQGVWWPWWRRASGLGVFTSRQHCCSGAQCQFLGLRILLLWTFINIQSPRISDCSLSPFTWRGQTYCAPK